MRMELPTDEPPQQIIRRNYSLNALILGRWLIRLIVIKKAAMTLDNATGNDLLPPHFSNHTKTHIYRYHQDPQNPDDNGVWVDSELIDEFAVIDPFEQYQERRFTLAIRPTRNFAMVISSARPARTILI